MSGHSKWKTIKRQKGANDAKRGQAFTKLSMAITLAVKQGGGIGDPAMNFRLRLAIEAARNANMPKDNIERAITRATSKDAANLEEVVYEGFGPGGISIIVEAVTDNKLRTTPEVKSIFDKNGGNIATPGSVSYQFQKAGMILVKKNGRTLDDIYLMSADNGAEDVEEVDDQVLIYTRAETLGKVRDNLISLGLEIVEAKLIRRPTTVITISDKESADKLLAFLEKLEEHPDVQEIYANYDIITP